MNDKTDNKISIDDFLSPLYELAEEIEEEKEKQEKEKHPEK